MLGRAGPSPRPTPPTSRSVPRGPGRDSGQRRGWPDATRRGSRGEMVIRGSCGAAGRSSGLPPCAASAAPVAGRGRGRKQEERNRECHRGRRGRAWSVGRLGLQPGQVVQELGWDDDVDEEFRVAPRGRDRRRAGSTRTPTTSRTSCCLVARGRRRPGRRSRRRADEPRRGRGRRLLTPKARPRRVTSSRARSRRPRSPAGLHGTSTLSAGQDWSGSPAWWRRKARTPVSELGA